MTNLARDLVDRADSRAGPVAEAGTGRLPRWVAQMSFRSRVVWLSTAAVAFAVVLASGITFAVVRDELRSQVDEELRELVDEIVRPAPGGGVIVDPPDPLRRTADYAQVVQRDGTVIPPSEGRVNVAVGERTLDAAAGNIDAFFEDQEIDGVHARVFTAPVPAREGAPSRRCGSLEEVDRSLRNLGIALVLVSLGGIALAVWLGRWWRARH